MTATAIFAAAAAAAALLPPADSIFGVLLVLVQADVVAASTDVVLQVKVQKQILQVIWHFLLDWRTDIVERNKNRGVVLLLSFAFLHQYLPQNKSKKSMRTKRYSSKITLTALYTVHQTQ